MSSIAWFDSAFSLQLTTVFLHFLWQGCLIGLIVFAGNALLHGTSAKRRYLFNLAALGAMAACIPVTFLLVERPATDPLSVTEPSIEATDIANLNAIENGADDFKAPPALSEPLSVIQDVEPDVSTTPVAAEETDAVHMADLNTIAPYFVACYLLGVCVMLLRLATGVWGGHRLRKETRQVEDPSILDTLAKQAGQFGLRFVPAIAWCERVSVPVVVGILKPMILLPATLTSGLTTDQLQALLMHELAHIRRFDLLANYFQRLAEALLFFHPVVWFVSRRVSIDREHAADDMVLEAGWPRTQYADALVRMAELSSVLRQSKPARRAVSLAATGTNSSEFKRRILRLLEMSDTPRLSLSRAGICLTLVVGITLAATPAIVKSWAHDKNAPEETQKTDLDAPFLRETQLIEREEQVPIPPAAAIDTQDKTTTPSPSGLAENDPVSTIDKSELPRVSKNYTHATRVASHLVTGGGIIERIVDNNIHLRSGDRIDRKDLKTVIVHRGARRTAQFAEISVLEPQMAIFYSMKNGTIEKIELEGIVEGEAASASVFDRIKELKLELGNETSSSLDGREPMSIKAKSGVVQIKIGETKLIELAKPTTSIEWSIGHYLPQEIDDIEPFDYLLVQWRENGRVTWTCYRSLATRDLEPAKPEPDPARPENSEAQNSPSPLIIRSASEFSKRLAELSEKYEYSTRLQKKGYVTALQVENERKQLDILKEELATQIRLLELEAENAARVVELTKDELTRIKQLTAIDVATKLDLQQIEVNSAKAVLSLEKLKQILELYRKVRSIYVPQEDDKKSTASDPAPYGSPRYVLPAGASSRHRFAVSEQLTPLTQQNEEQTRFIKEIREIETAIDLATGEKRDELLREAMEGYEELYQKYRSESLGLWSRYYQARCLWRLGQTDEAEKIFDELLKLPHDNDVDRKRHNDFQERIEDLKKSD